jgi:hypothetical protein
MGRNVRNDERHDTHIAQRTSVCALSNPKVNACLVKLVRAAQPAFTVTCAEVVYADGALDARPRAAVVPCLRVGLVKRLVSAGVGGIAHGGTRDGAPAAREDKGQGKVHALRVFGGGVVHHGQARQRRGDDKRERKHVEQGEQGDDGRRVQERPQTCASSRGRSCAHAQGVARASQEPGSAARGVSHSLE